MICKVLKTVERYAMLQGARSVVVGLSGGADSVCLLHILMRLRDEYKFELSAVHVNHNLRGDEAKRDEDFAKSLCEKYGVPLKCVNVDVSALASQKGLGLEECGRLVRYEAFDSVSADKIALAHSLSDSIETALFNLSRGTALSGACGIQATRDNIIRPLIECSRSQIEEYCRENSLAYVTDSTNLEDDYTRNFIRHNIVPQFKRLNPNFESGFLRFLNSARDDDVYLDTLAQNALERARVGGGYDRTLLCSLERPLLNRALRILLQSQMKKQVEQRHIELFEDIINNQGKIQLTKDLYIVAKNDIILFQSIEPQVDFWQVEPINGEFISPFKSYTVTFFSSDNLIIKGDNNIGDACLLSDSLVLRSRKQGDRITLKKRGVGKSLKKLFNESKIPTERRNKIAVLESGGRLVWVEGFGVSSEFAPNEKTEKFFIIKSKEG